MIYLFYFLFFANVSIFPQHLIIFETHFFNADIVNASLSIKKTEIQLYCIEII